MPRYQNPSPSFPFLAGLFGQNTTFKKGTYQLAKPTDETTAGGLFGPTAAANIGNYLNLTGNNAYTQALGNIGQSGNFQGLPPELRDAYYTATGNLDRFIGESQPVVSSMIQTGLPTDIGSLVEAAKSRYTNQFLPQAAEQYNPATGTGFANIAAREANLMGTELGQLDFAAQEAARQRQQWGISTGAPALASMSSQRLALPGAVLQELQGLSQTSDPGGRLLAALMQLLGQSEQQSAPVNIYGAGAAGGGGATESWMGAIGGALGGAGSILGMVCWVAEELFGMDDLRTHHARLWCALHPEHPFVRAYKQYGIGWAHLVSTNAAFRGLALPVWERMATEGGRIARQLN